MNILTVFIQMSILFSLIIMGYILGKINWVKPESYGLLSKLVVNVFNPFLTIYSVLGQSLSSTGTIFWQNLCLVFCLYTFLFISSYLFIWIIKPNKIDSPIYKMLILFPNLGFMGIPIVYSLLGSEYIIYVATYMLFYNILFYTYGIYHAKKSACEANGTTMPTSSDSSIWSFLKNFMNPGIISSIVAIVIFFADIAVPMPVESFLLYMSNPCVPLSMILIGCSLSYVYLRELFNEWRTYVFILYKMILIPIIAAIAIQYLPFDEKISQLCIILIAMPAGTLVAIASKEYGSPVTCGTNCVLLSTVSSLFTLPIISLFL